MLGAKCYALHRPLRPFRGIWKATVQFDLINTAAQILVVGFRCLTSREFPEKVPQSQGLAGPAIPIY